MAVGGRPSRLRCRAGAASRLRPARSQASKPPPKPPRRYTIAAARSYVRRSPQPGPALSPLWAAKRCLADLRCLNPTPHAHPSAARFKAAVESYLEELVVRRELSDNFCHYTPDYDRLSCAAQWARDSLEAHRGDKREFVYTRCGAPVA
jgi:hypothetical protein